MPGLRQGLGFQLKESGKEAQVVCSDRQGLGFQLKESSKEAQVVCSDKKHFGYGLFEIIRKRKVANFATFRFLLKGSRNFFYRTRIGNTLVESIVLLKNELELQRFSCNVAIRSWKRSHSTRTSLLKMKT